MGKNDLLQLLSRPVAFHPVLARAAGSAAAGLFLSQLIYWTGKGHDPLGWIRKSWQEWEEETCLSQGEQRGARKKLIKLRIVQERRRGLDPTLWFQVDFDRLDEIIQQNQFAACNGNFPLPDGISPSGGGEFPSADVEIPTGNTESTSETTTEITTTKSGGSGLQDVAIHQELEKYLPSLSLPASMDHYLRQQLVDELAGAVRGGLVKSTPARFLTGLVKRAQSGDFHPDFANQIFRERVSRAKNEEAVARARAGGDAPARGKRTAPPGGSLKALCFSRVP